jgi:hypothetical protein
VERGALDLGRAAVADRVLEQVPIAVAEAKAEDELADVVEQAGRECVGLVDLRALGEHARGRRDHRGVDPEARAEAARVGAVSLERAPDAQPEHEIAHAREAEQRHRLRDARHLAAHREEGRVRDAEQPRRERLVARDQRCEVVQARGVAIDRRERLPRDLRRRRQLIDRHELAVEPLQRGVRGGPSQLRRCGGRSS